MQDRLQHLWWATGLTALALSGCGGSSGSPAPAPAPSGPDVTQRSTAATTTAQSTTNACNGIRPFYWEIGDGTQRLAGTSVNASGSGVTWDANSQMSIASASKWLYGAYVAERRNGALTAEDIQYLNFRSGYTNFTFSGCDAGDTVASCVARDNNGVQNSATVDKFFYNGGHMQVHANLPSPGMALGALDNATLATEIRRLLGNEIALTYTQPQLAGGVRTTPANYAIYLRKLLNHQLRMTALLGTSPVCTNPTTCSTAVYTPAPTSLSWHYSVGHWVEDDPATGDGAFSSPGAFGFYPWVDSSKTWYGIVARQVVAGYQESAACGALIRKAWLTGTAQ